MFDLKSPKYSGNDECPCKSETLAINETDNSILSNAALAEIQSSENDIFDLAGNICLQASARRRRLRMS